METSEICGSAEELLVEETNKEGKNFFMGGEKEGEVEGIEVEETNREENSVMDGEKRGEMEGIEVKGEEEKKTGDLEAAALKIPKKRGRKKKETLPSKRTEKEFLEEEEEEGGEKVEVDLGAAGIGEGKNGDSILKTRLRAVSKRVSYADFNEYEDEELPTRKRRRKGWRKKTVDKSDAEKIGHNENGDDRITAKKRGTRGRPTKQVSESDGHEGKDVKEEGKEEQDSALGVGVVKKRGRRAAEKDGKMDKEAEGNGESSEKQEEPLGMNTDSKYPLRQSRVAKKEDPLPDSKKDRDKVNIMLFNCCLIVYDVFSSSSFYNFFFLVFNSGLKKNH